MLDPLGEGGVLGHLWKQKKLIQPAGPAIGGPEMLGSVGAATFRSLELPMDVHIYIYMSYSLNS